MAKSTEQNRYNPLGVAIREMRGKKPQKLIADECNISRGYVSQLESGLSHSPSNEVLQCIAEKTGNNPQILLEIKNQTAYDNRGLIFNAKMELQKIQTSLSQMRISLSLLEEGIGNDIPQDVRTKSEFHPDNF